MKSAQIPGRTKNPQCTAKRWQTSCVEINFQASRFGVENEGSVKTVVLKPGIEAMLRYCW